MSEPQPPSEIQRLLGAFYNTADITTIGRLFYNQWPDDNGQRLFQEYVARRHDCSPDHVQKLWRSFHETPKTLSVSDLMAHAPATVLPLINKQETGVPVTLLTMDNINELPDTSWLIHDLIPAHHTGLLYGQTQSYRTFITLHMALSLVTGQPFQGHVSQKTQVLYMVGECVNELPKRILGWQQHYGINVIDNNPDMVFSQGCFDFSVDHHYTPFLNQLDSLKKRGFKPGLIIVDTLSKSFLGNEDNSNDVATYLRSVDDLRQLTGATILLVHYCDRAESHKPAGHPRLYNDVEFAIEVERTALYQAQLRNRKHKGIAENQTTPVVLKPIHTTRGSTLVPVLP